MKRTLILSITFALAATLGWPLQAQDLASQIVGVWKFTGISNKEVASGKVAHPQGEKPTGLYVFTKGGLIVWSAVGDNRKGPAGSTFTDAERAELFKTSSSGSGTYKVDDDNVSITYDTSWNHVWTGTTQKRKAEIVGKKLTLTSPPIRSPATGLDIVVTSTFERVE